MFKLNLQLFADGDPIVSNGGYANYLNARNIDPASMSTTANIGAGYKDASGNPVTGALSNLSAEMKEYYSQYLIKDVGPNLLHAQFLDDEKLPKNHGRTIEWRKWEDFEKQTTPVVEGVTPAPMKLSVNPLRAEISQYIGWVLLTDQVQLLTVDNVLVEYTEKLSQNAKLSLDTVTREKIVSGCTNKVFAGGSEYIYETTGKLTPNDVAKMATFLKNNNAPKYDGSYVAIIHPTVSYDLMTDEHWIDVQKYSNATAIFSGEIGKLYGVRFVESTEAKLVKAKKIGTGDAGGAAIKVVSYNSTTHVATVASDTFVADELNGKKVMVHDVSDTSKTTVAEMTVSDTGTDSITFSAEAAGFTINAGDIIYSKESALDGADYFVCLFFGKGFGKKVALTSDNARIIVKPVGSSGSEDPGDQRGTVAWKVDGYTAAVTNPSYVFAYYCTSAITGVKAND